MYGLVLEGGGAKGSYHAGVYRAIEELGIEIGGIAGSSIGALNGAMILQDDLEQWYGLWNDISYSMILDMENEEVKKIKNLSLSKEDLSLLGETIKRFLRSGGIETTKIKEIIEEYVDEEKIRSTNKDFGIVTLNLTERKAVKIFLEDIPKGDLHKYLLASAYLPVFKFERLDGDIYLDGGFYDNLPYDMLKEKGYDKLILVRTHAPGIVRKIDLDEINGIIISPSEDLGKTYHYEAERARRNMKLGYLDALKAFDKVLGKAYYIKADEDEKYYLEYLLRLGQDEVRKMEELLYIDKKAYRRSLFEDIMPIIHDYLDLDMRADYKTIILYLLEVLAAKYKLERLELYEFEELLSTIQDHIEEEAKSREGEESSKELSGIDKIIDRMESIPMFHKEKVLENMGKIIFRRRNNGNHI